MPFQTQSLTTSSTTKFVVQFVTSFEPYLTSYTILVDPTLSSTSSLSAYLHSKIYHSSQSKSLHLPYPRTTLKSPRHAPPHLLHLQYQQFYFISSNSLSQFMSFPPARELSSDKFFFIVSAMGTTDIPRRFFAKHLPLSCLAPDAIPISSAHSTADPDFAHHDFQPSNSASRPLSSVIALRIWSFYSSSRDSWITISDDENDAQSDVVQFYSDDDLGCKNVTDRLINTNTVLHLSFFAHVSHLRVVAFQPCQILSSYKKILLFHTHFNKSRKRPW